MTIGRATVAATVVFSVVGCGSGSGAGESGPGPGAGAGGGQSGPVAPLFTDATDSSGIFYQHGYSLPTGTDVEWFAGGVAAGDYDADGDVDLFVVRGDAGPNQLYRNSGTGTFSEVAAQAGLAYTKSATENDRLSGPTFADMDGDGYLDLFIGGFEGSPSYLYRNNGDGTFSDVSQASGIRSMQAENTISAAFGDYDKDGDVDMFLSHWGNATTFRQPGRYRALVAEHQFRR